MKPELYTITEAADILRVSRKTVDRLRKRGELVTHYVTSGSPRISGKSLRKLIGAACVFLAVHCAPAAELSLSLLDAIGRVESGLNHAAVGDGGAARGAWQMHRAAFEDASQWRKARGLEVWDYSKVHHPVVGRAYAYSYLAILDSRLKGVMGDREPTAADLYCAWNLGVRGYQRRGFNLRNCPAVTRRAVAKLEGFLK
tara:strand:- start:2838 stop:3434 length:597 start_codon:yes stop_codon:yes gene_type:complete